MQNQKQTIKKSEILELQSKGMKMKEVSEYYKVPLSEIKVYYSKLNIKTKAKKPLQFDVFDDTKTPEELDHQVNQLHGMHVTQ